ncbi:DUF5985 family protein [Polyangium sp. y55x31]|uniref:DUF5985 family protein n=1 Tax=Polyangium sp. y55x31 TaxID=3042688 RepID=UPI0024827DB6|nr:DUF5985 family protein [Polyangium sp. y55x31]MDI1475236.1 DUF5985 family protein [Polyangium sp. y55x31]
MNDLISGALILGFAVIALFFLRFWRSTRDRLFAIFALSFSLMAVNRLILAIAKFPEDNYPYVYLVRLVANALIIYAVIDKNRAHKRSAASDSGATPRPIP